MANPNNVMNQNLAIGGNLAVVGNAAVTGDAVIVGDVVATDRIASGTAIGLVTPTLGTFSLDFTEVLVPLSTTSATTTFSFGTGGLPAGALGVAVSIRVVSTITGINSTTGTLNVNPTSGLSPVTTISTFTAGATSELILPTGGTILDADAGTFVLSGGGVNIPSGGSIRITAYFWRVTPPTS